MAATVVACVLLFAPASDERCRKGVGEACTVSWYELEVKGVDTLYFTSFGRDGLPTGLSSRQEEVSRTFRSNAFFVAWSGRLLTAADSLTRPGQKPEDLHKMLRGALAQLTKKQKTCTVLLDEMDYYRRTHSVVDDGFHQVMAHDEEIRAQAEDISRCRQVVEAALKGATARVRFRAERTVCFHATGDTARMHRLACRLLSGQPQGMEVWQTINGKVPYGIPRFRLVPFPYFTLRLPGSLFSVCAHWGSHGREAAAHGVRPSLVRTAMPKAMAAVPLVDGGNGAPVFGTAGCLAGMYAHGRIWDSWELYRQSMAHASWAWCVWEDAKAWGLHLRDAWLHWKETGTWQTETPHASRLLEYGTWQEGDTSYYGQLADGIPEGEGIMEFPNGTYSGNWQRGRREGFGEWTDTAGRVFQGHWQADTLQRGTFRDSMGEYRGRFNRNLEAHGHGRHIGKDGSYYSGQWTDGRRNGFGFSVCPGEVVKCGVWRRGTFRGEQMLYHAERVYGIDISKYQHVRGRRVYGIDWPRLRITHLGHISRKKVEGEVDYPVSFVYIKCTEGMTVRNPYYAKDLRAARRHGYPVGAYHFFSTRPARKQAAYFLRHANLKRGDLPPMLDMELNDRKIAAMGGRDVLFREMLTWLDIVGRRTGTTPILYVNQNFVNRHLPFAPEALKAYPVWVARYGEYKPYVHLLYWQLSPDGTVRGIRGGVDIDVFNGSKAQFERYLRTQTVK